ncbi:hypothetical protein GSVR_05190 [Geobacter sp. SVR]|nr:hypothetical protein GSVR_05190 [Geobacter sp. SVR]
MRIKPTFTATHVPLFIHVIKQNFAMYNQLKLRSIRSGLREATPGNLAVFVFFFPVMDTFYTFQYGGERAGGKDRHLRR